MDGRCSLKFKAQSSTGEAVAFWRLNEGGAACLLYSNYDLKERRTKGSRMRRITLKIELQSFCHNGHWPKLSSTAPLPVMMVQMILGLGGFCFGVHELRMVGSYIWVIYSGEIEGVVSSTRITRKWVGTQGHASVESSFTSPPPRETARSIAAGNHGRYTRIIFLAHSVSSNNSTE